MAKYANPKSVPKLPDLGKTRTDCRQRCLYSSVVEALSCCCFAEAAVCRAAGELACRTSTHRGAARAAMCDVLDAQLELIRDSGTWKRERVLTSSQGRLIRVQGRRDPVLNFCANNYLGLSVSNSPLSSVAANTSTTLLRSRRWLKSQDRRTERFLRTGCSPPCQLGIRRSAVISPSGSPTSWRFRTFNRLTKPLLM